LVLLSTGKADETSGVQPYSIGRKAEEGAGVQPYIIDGIGWDIRQHPYDVHIQRSNSTNFFPSGDSWGCSGVILDETLVCSTAHCFEEATVGPFTHVRVIAGANSINDNDFTVGTQTRTLEKADIQTHPRHVQYNYAHDFACMVMDPPLPFSEWIGSIDLPAQKKDYCELKSPVFYEFDSSSNSDNCVISGWGVRDASNLNQRSWWPGKATPVILDNAGCGAWSCYGENVICIDGSGPRACLNDGGSSLVCEKDGRKVLAGISSYLVGSCDSETFPEIYTSIQTQFDFIQSFL